MMVRLVDIDALENKIYEALNGDSGHKLTYKEIDQIIEKAPIYEERHKGGYNMVGDATVNSLICRECIACHKLTPIAHYCMWCGAWA